MNIYTIHIASAIQMHIWLSCAKMCDVCMGKVSSPHYLVTKRIYEELRERSERKRRERDKEREKGTDLQSH